MRVTVVHNPTAGGGRLSRDDLVGHLRRVGYDVRYQSAKTDDLARALDAPGDLVLAAGGDGTVANVAKRLVGRGVPLAILPTGTANNVARSHGVHGTPQQLIDALRPERLPHVARAPWNVGVARGPWGEARFVEAAGVGLFAQHLRVSQREDAEREDAERGGGAAGAAGAGGGDEIERGRRRLQRVLGAAVPRRLRIEADGEDVSGDYLLADVLNVRAVGPRIELAPAAGRGDGHLTLVLVGEDDRRAFRNYLVALTLVALTDGRGGASPVPARRVRCVRLSWPPGDGHLDDELWPAESAPGVGPAIADSPTVEVTTADGRLEVLVPGGGRLTT